MSKKEMEVKAMARKGVGRGEFDVGSVDLVPPPPAYTHEDGNESVSTVEGHQHHQQRQQQWYYGHQ